MDKMNSEGAVFVTGATSGLGRNIATELAAAGRRVVVAGRRAQAVNELVAEITSSGGSATGFVADLSDLDDMRRSLDHTEMPPLHGIVANAGITTDDLAATSAQGLDLTFAVNVLSHQMLFHELAGQLLPNSRIVVVTSGVHHPANKLARRLRVPLPTWVGTEKLARQQSQAGPDLITKGPGRYSTSKLANVYQARQLQQRLDGMGLESEVFALDPGLMVDTNLAREIPAPARLMLRSVGRLVTPLVSNMRPSTTTAEYVTELIESPTWADQGFCYVDGIDREPLGELALRDDHAEALWNESTELIRPYLTSEPQL